MLKKSKSAKNSKKAGRVLKTGRVSQVLQQARESLRILETLERETLAKARTFVKNPISFDRKKLTNERVLMGLRRIGVATQSEVDALKARIERLEAEGHGKKSGRSNGHRARQTQAMPS